MGRKKSIAAKIELMLYTYKTNLKGESQVYIRIHKNGRKLIGTGVMVKEDDWDNTTVKDEDGNVIVRPPSFDRIKKGVKGRVELNNKLNKLLQDARDAANKDETTDVTASAKRITRKIKGSENQQDYITYAAQYIERFNNEDQYGTYTSHLSTLTSLKSWINGAKEKGKVINVVLPFSDIDTDFINSYRKHLLKSGERGKRSMNTAAAHLKKMKTILRDAVEEGVIDFNGNPFNFKRNKIKWVPTMKEKLSTDEMTKLRKVKLEPWTPMWHARNVFVLQYMFRGVRISDIVTMKESAVSGNRFSKMSIKSKVYTSGDISPEAQNIIDAYIQGKKERDIESPYLIPLVKDGPENPYVLRSRATSYVNKYLKDLAALVGITKNLSSHISRHSFAQHGRNDGMQDHQIGALLGHRSSSETKTYLSGLDNPTLDKLTRRITG